MKTLENQKGYEDLSARGQRVHVATQVAKDRFEWKPAVIERTLNDGALIEVRRGKNPPIRVPASDVKINYSSMEPLECCEFKNINRRIGVEVTHRVSDHIGIGGAAVDINYETPDLNTSTFGGWKPEAQETDEIRSMTKTVISNLAKVIGELTGHKERLENELKNIEADQEKARQIKEAKEEKCENLEVNLEKDPKWNHLEQGNDSSGKLAAKNIRKELKVNFPEAKFSVRMRHWGTLSISQVVGEPIDGSLIEEITCKYKEGSFNGMEDIYEYSTSSWNKVFGGAKYIFLNY